MLDAPVGLVLLSPGCGLALKEVRQGLRGVRLAGHLNEVVSNQFLVQTFCER